MTTPSWSRLPGLCLAALGVAMGVAVDAAPVEHVAPGAPLEHRYTSADYGATPSHYGVLTDAEGRVYAANVEGLLRFSAGRFELFPLPNKAQVEALVIGGDGRAYYGGYDYFGYLEESVTGEAHFHDLTPNFHLPPGESGVGQVWTMARIEDRVYVQTDERMFVIHADGRGDTFKAPAKMHRLFVVNGAIYARLDGIGLTRLEGQEFKPIPGAERFAALGVTYVEARPEGKLLILSRDQGFFEGDADGVKPLATRADAALKSLEMFTALRLPDGSLVIATRSGDLLRLDADLALIHRYRVSSYPLTDLALDQQGGLWVATQGDLVRLEVPSPWSVFTDADGLTGSLADSVWYGGRRWVSSTVGLERSYVDAEGRMRFEKLPWTTYEVWDLEPTRTGLLYAGREALSLVVNDKPQVVSKAEFPSQINVSPFSHDRIYVPYEPGFIVLNQTATGWKEAGRFEPEGLSVGGIVETAPGELWLGNNRGAPQRVKLSADGSRLLERQVIGQAEGLPAQGKVSYPVQVDDQLLMVMNEKFFAWDGKHFAPSDAGGLAALITRPDELTVRTAPDGTRYAFTSRELLVRKPSERAWRALQVDSPLARGFTQLSVEADGSVSLIGWNALLSFDPNVAVPTPAPLKTRLYRVRLHKQDNSTRLLDRRGGEINVPPHRTLEVEFGLDAADPGIEYRSELEGLDAGYGDWSKTPRREFAGLAPGTYTLRVEARTGAGRAAEPLSFTFHVEPRWYQTIWARAAAALLLLLAGLLLARHYAARRLHLVETRNRKLEELISERTAELARANRQLARLATLDGLTAIPNRRAFDNFIEHALARCRDRNEPLSLLMLDVDHFKRYNDRHGHLAGDDVLRSIAAELVRFSRGEGEQLARYGGEEFALVLANVALPEARRRAEEICAHFRERAGPEGLTISIGVVSKVPKTGDTTRLLIDAADHALYDAKHKGRARVELAAA